MAKTLKDKMAELPAQRRRRIEQETERLQAEYRTLQDLRKARALTQTQLAETLGIRQATVAQMEKRTDLLLSTLRSYVEAMGGELKLTVKFPDKPGVTLDGLGDVDEPIRRRKRNAGEAPPA